MTANAKDAILAIAGQAGGVACAIEDEVEVGAGLITHWYAGPHLCEISRIESHVCSASSAARGEGWCRQSGQNLGHCFA